MNLKDLRDAGGLGESKGEGGERQVGAAGAQWTIQSKPAERPKQRYGNTVRLDGRCLANQFANRSGEHRSARGRGQFSDQPDDQPNR
jgi:hypothetical protein